MNELKKLDFTIPAFQRISWASQQARSMWEPWLQEIRDACEYASLSLVASGRLKNVAMRVRPFRVFSFKRRARELDVRLEVLGEDAPTAYRFIDCAYNLSDSSILILIGEMSQFERAFNSLSNDEDVTNTSGWPRCCSEFHSRECNKDWKDRTWRIAVNSASFRGAETSFFPESSWANNFLLHRIGLWPLAHLPCSFECSESANLVMDVLTIMRENKLHDVAERLVEVLNWPAEYSVLHGIAELKTPILKMVADTDATADKHTVRFMGTGYPSCAPNGVQFPYRMPTKLRISDSNSFNRGFGNAMDS